MRQFSSIMWGLFLLMFSTYLVQQFSLNSYTFASLLEEPQDQQEAAQETVPETSRDEGPPVIEAQSSAVSDPENTQSPEEETGSTRAGEGEGVTDSQERMSSSETVDETAIVSESSSEISKPPPHTPSTDAEKKNNEENSSKESSPKENDVEENSDTPGTEAEKKNAEESSLESDAKKNSDTLSDSEKASEQDEALEKKSRKKRENMSTESDPPALPPSDPEPEPTPKPEPSQTPGHSPALATATPIPETVPKPMTTQESRAQLYKDTRPETDESLCENVEKREAVMLQGKVIEGAFSVGKKIKEDQCPSNCEQEQFFDLDPERPKKGRCKKIPDACADGGDDGIKFTSQIACQSYYEKRALEGDFQTLKEEIDLKNAKKEMQEKYTAQKNLCLLEGMTSCQNLKKSDLRSCLRESILPCFEWDPHIMQIESATSFDELSQLGNKILDFRIQNKQ